MFLFERLFALAIYVLILLIVCFFLSQRNSNYKRIFFVYTLLLATMGFFYVPYETADLYRIYELLKDFSRYDWDKFLYYELAGDLLKVDSIYYWLIAKTGEFRLLPAINAILCYSCIFYIISHTAERYNISRKNIAIATFFFMSIGTYMGSIAGIRSMLGVSLMSFCFFRESIEKKFKWWHIPIYLFAVFVHHFVFVLMVGRLIVPILTRKMSVVKKMGYLIFVGILGLIAIMLFRSYIGEIINKGKEYIEDSPYTYAWGYLIAVIVGGMLLSIVFKVRRSVNENNLNDFYLYVIFCLCIAVCFIYEYSIFVRCIRHIASVIALPLLMLTLQKQDLFKTISQNQFRIAVYNEKISYKTKFLLWVVVLLLLTCARGELCSLKFFVL